MALEAARRWIAFEPQSLNPRCAEAFAQAGSQDAAGHVGMSRSRCQSQSRWQELEGVKEARVRFAQLYKEVTSMDSKGSALSSQLSALSSEQLRSAVSAVLPSAQPSAFGPSAPDSADSEAKASVMLPSSCKSASGAAMSSWSIAKQRSRRRRRRLRRRPGPGRSAAEPVLCASQSRPSRGARALQPERSPGHGPRWSEAPPQILGPSEGGS